MPRTTVNPTIYSPETMFGTEAVYNQPSFQFMEQALPDAFPAYCSQDYVGEWPSDLDELVANWDEEGNVWDVIKWFPAPTHTAVPTPRMVTYVQEMMSQWDETFDNKCLQVMEWLGYPDVASPQVEPPKVVVEAQPSSSQAYNQWSSMNEHT
ncbi:uncharacterized protein LOC128987547 [Macrosteles quadrilineatus]|uniref:uncharacterized protein LOC128987547 n=1 Tax=Macrosteles quadrilineatus TaxID=74068 RepID=UPI0023E13FD8|nr:uncharacterized protein LOC128987547 [Macrosteles quadrilineatus]